MRSELTRDEALDLALRIAYRCSAGKATHLRIETAWKVVQALKAYRVPAPHRDDFARALCVNRAVGKGGCASLCMSCIGTGNQVVQVLEERNRS